MDSTQTISSFFSWFEEVLRGFSDLWGWLNTPFVEISGNAVTPLMCFGFGGLAIIIGYAIVKWVIPV